MATLMKTPTNTVNFLALSKMSSVDIVVLQKFLHLETRPQSRRNTQNRPQ